MRRKYSQLTWLIAFSVRPHCLGLSFFVALSLSTIFKKMLLNPLINKPLLFISDILPSFITHQAYLPGLFPHHNATSPREIYNILIFPTTIFSLVVFPLASARSPMYPFTHHHLCFSSPDSFQSLLEVSCKGHSLVLIHTPREIVPLFYSLFTKQKWINHLLWGHMKRVCHPLKNSIWLERNRIISR